VTTFDPMFDELFGKCQRSAVHLEMHDNGPHDDTFAAWQAGQRIDPAARWPHWLQLASATVARGVTIRRARIVSEPVSEYVRYEYDVTDGLNIAGGEQVRWLARRHASDLALPGNDYWLFDNQLVQFNHFSGDGDWIDVEQTTAPATIEFCSSAFEAVWQRATPHQQYRPA
jgi:hypothetical protein